MVNGGNLPSLSSAKVGQTPANFKYKLYELKGFSIDSWGGSQIAGVPLHNSNRVLTEKYKRLESFIFSGPKLVAYPYLQSIPILGTRINLVCYAIRCYNLIL